jgi:glycosyltransferase involved in cell wall biosynthesis
MRPIKVLHVTEVEKEAHYFNNLADFTDSDEIDFSFVTFAEEAEFALAMRARGLKVWCVRPLTRSSLFRGSADLARIMHKVDPDVVHTHLFAPTVVGLATAKRHKRRTLITRHHSDALHAIANPIKRRFYLSLERRNNARADHIIAPSHFVRHCLVDLEGVPVERVTVIPYGQRRERFDAIAPDAIRSKRRELQMEGSISLVCVSRLYPRKGQQYLFEAIAQLVKDGLDLRLYLVGEGDDRQRLEKLAAELSITSHIRFLGFRDDILEIIGAADCIVHPSLEDALSQSLIESLMMGRPIVATDISGASDTLDGGKYGRLVPPADVEGLRFGITETIKDLAVARERAAAGRKYLLEYMDVKRVTCEYAKLYRKLVSH